MCILLGMGGQNDKVHLKNIKLFRIILKKKIFFNFFQKFWGGQGPLGPVDHPPLGWNLMLQTCLEPNIFLTMD